jgi:hypothetical protein
MRLGAPGQLTQLKIIEISLSQKPTTVLRKGRRRTLIEEREVGGEAGVLSLPL